MLFAGSGRTVGHAKGRQGTVENRGVENGGNDWTERFYGVKQSGSSERE